MDQFMKEHGIKAADFPALQGFFEQKAIEIVRTLPSKKRTVLWEGEPPLPIIYARSTYKYYSLIVYT